MNYEARVYVILLCIMSVHLCELTRGKMKKGVGHYCHCSKRKDFFWSGITFGIDSRAKSVFLRYDFLP